MPKSDELYGNYEVGLCASATVEATVTIRARSAKQAVAQALATVLHELEWTHDAPEDGEADWQYVQDEAGDVFWPEDLCEEGAQ